jgi:signal transduction histidine kinase
LKINFNIAIYLGLALLVSCGKSISPRSDLTQYQFKETRDLVSFVNDAAVLFSEKGEDAFIEFGKKEGKWFYGSKYIFIYDQSGVCVFHPVIKESVGKNLLEFKDINGKPVGKFINLIASNRGKPYGWIHYLWAEPGEIFPSWKNAYIMRVKGPDGKFYAVGSGTYNIRTEMQFVTDVVDSAANLIQNSGKEAYRHLLDQTSIFYFNNTYIFVLALNGQLLVDPSFPTRISRNLIDFKDYSGHMIIREMLQKFQKEDIVHIPYLWPAPGQNNLLKKLIYARKAISGSDTVIVGSSLFLMEPIWEKF